MDGCPGVGVTPSQNHLTWINSLWNHAQCHVVNSGTGGPSWGLWLQGRAYAEIPAVLCHVREGTGPSPALCPQGSGHLPRRSHAVLVSPSPGPGHSSWPSIGWRPGALSLAPHQHQHLPAASSRVRGALTQNRRSRAGPKQRLWEEEEVRSSGLI